MPNLKSQFAAAKQHINQGNYVQARAVLSQIGHPKATDWIKRIDKIAPPVTSKPTPQSPRLWPWIAAATLIVVIAISAVLYIQNQNEVKAKAAENVRLKQEAEVWALTVISLEDYVGLSSEDAEFVADVLIELYPSDLYRCAQLYPLERIERFSECINPNLIELSEGVN